MKHYGYQTKQCVEETIYLGFWIIELVRYNKEIHSRKYYKGSKFSVESNEFL